MRTACLSLAAATVFLLLLLLTTSMEVVEAIRLDAESRAAVNVNHHQQQQVNVANQKPSQNDDLTQTVDAAGERPSSLASEMSETKRSIAIAVAVAVAVPVSVAGQEVVKATAHKLPEFHEDYYGASVHEPRHH